MKTQQSSSFNEFYRFIFASYYASICSGDFGYLVDCDHVYRYVYVFMPVRH